MVEEIVYTSAEKGLKQGSRGFCTVLSTAGMSLALAERLESMSGYRHAFPLHDPQASLNPVCLSHVTTRLAGKTLHVISRVADAGQDYTGRSNKLAHHLVIDNVASMPAGPARLMAEPGVIVEQWDGNVRNVPPRELRCAPLPASIPLVAWQGLTGDEGWAGAVAEQLLQNPAPVSIIFNPGTDTLTLVREVLDLVPAAQRWNVTFSTYFTRLLAGAECQLRFVLNDTPEATSLRNDARARVIDLTSSLPAATGGTLVAMARKGQLTPQEPAQQQATAAVRARTAVEISRKDTGAEISIPKLKPGLSPLETPDKPLPPREVPPSVRVNNRKSLWIGVTLALIVVTVTGVLIFLRPAKNNDAFADLVNKVVPQERQQAEAEEARIAREQAEKDRREQEEREKEEKRAADEAAKKEVNDAKMEAEKLAAAKQAETLQREAMEVQAKAVRRAELEKAGPFAFVKYDKQWQDIHGQWLFELPLATLSDSEDSQRKGLPIRAGGNNVSLTFHECAESILGPDSDKPELKPSAMEPDTWEAVVQRGNEAIRLAKYSVVKLETSVGNEDAADCEIHFSWLKDAKREVSAAERLRWTPLTIKINGRFGVFLQRRSFVPQKQPDWKTLVDSSPFEFPKEPGLEGLDIGGKLGVAFRLKIRQKKNETATFTLRSKADSPALEYLCIDDAVGDVEPSHKELYFPLHLPIILDSTVPTYAPDLVGFGKIEMRLWKSQRGVFMFHPALSLKLHIPSPNFAQESVGPGTLKALRDVKDNPELLEGFDPAQTENEIARLRRDFEAVDEEISRWHEQRWQHLPKRELYSKTQFFELKEAAISKLSPLIEKYPRESKDVDEGQNKKRKSVHSFIPQMQLFEKELKLQLDTVVRMYDKAAIEVNDLIEHENELSIACQLFHAISVSDAENGPVVNLIFLECDSVESPR